MNTYIVLYRNNSIGLSDHPFGFKCEAEDMDHAEEQCLNAEPDAAIYWTVETSDYQEALEHYYHWDEYNKSVYGNEL